MSQLNKPFGEALLQTILPVTGEYITDPHGISCPVLDTSKIDFSHSVSGRKIATTLVRRANEGEGLGQKFQGGQETFEYITKEGDAIFVNGPTDQYVPPSKDGGRLKFNDLEQNGFKIASSSQNEAQVKSPPAKLLVGIIDARVCIKNAWGNEDKPDNHQFLSPGATLKQGGDGKVTGIDKEGFTKWEIDAHQSPPGPQGGTLPS